MTFNDYLEAQFQSGRIDRGEFERGLQKAREAVDIDPEFTRVVNEEFWNIL